MGLAAPRKRRKLGHDPNNTTWTRASQNYGHRILAAQGWTPGSVLGAKDAAHASSYSSGSSTPLQLAVKEGNLGLGARKATMEETNGMGDFQDLLARLNGQSSEQIEQDQKDRADLGRKLYAQQRYGVARFVKGGFLLGTKEEHDVAPAKSLEDGGEILHSLLSAEERESNAGLVNSVEASARKKRSKKTHSQKEGAENNGTASEERVRDKEKKRTGRKDKKKASTAASDILEMNEISPPSSAEINRSKTTMNAVDGHLEQVGSESAASAMSSSKTSDEKLGYKKDRSKRKKNRIKGENESSKGDELVQEQPLALLLEDSKLAVEPTSTTLHSISPINRHGIRQRYIQSKRRVLQDPQALREILML